MVETPKYYEIPDHDAEGTVCFPQNVYIFIFAWEQSKYRPGPVLRKLALYRTPKFLPPACLRPLEGNLNPCLQRCLADGY